MVKNKTKQDFSIVSYIFGIMSVVFILISPLPGIVFGIIGLVHSKKQETELSKKGGLLSKIGLIGGVLIFILLILLILFGVLDETLMI